MFISTLDLLKVGVGPSSSHTMGPMVAAFEFLQRINEYCFKNKVSQAIIIRCTLKGSLSATGKGHATDHVVTLGLNNYLPKDLVDFLE